MGIGRQSAMDLVTAVKAATTREQMRAEIADAVTALNEWLNKRDTQDAAAAADFAAQQAAQFQLFQAALPDVVLDAAPATTAAPTFQLADVLKVP